MAITPSRTPYLHTRESTTTLETWDTSSSVTTVWGPGTLSGKAIKALGEATLRGVDKLIIRWKLATINSSLPRTKYPEATSAEKLERIYDDVLELSRLDYYDYKVRQQALRLIMMQIGSLETNQLVKCIVKWPAEEIRIFLSELYPCMLLLWDSQESAPEFRLELIAVYRSSQSPSEADEAIPFISFIEQLSEESSESCDAILSGGFLDLLVRIYEYHSLDFGEDRLSSPVINACNPVLRTFLTHSSSFSFIASYPKLAVLWPHRYKTLQLSLLSRILSQFNSQLRKDVWAKMDEQTIIERFCEIEVVLSFYPTPVTLSTEICLDLMTFMTNTRDAKFKQSILRLILQCIALGDHFWGSLRKALLVSTYEDILDLFYRIIYPLSKWPSESLPAATIFAKEVDAHHPELSPVEQFVDFALTIANCDTLARPLIDAEFLCLLPSTRYDRSTQAWLYASLQRKLDQGVRP